MFMAAWLEGGAWRIFADEQRGLVKDIAYYQAGLVEDLVESPVFLYSREDWQFNGRALWFRLSVTDGKPCTQLYNESLPKELEALLIVYGLQ